jgi:hypothetical protein
MGTEYKSNILFNVIVLGDHALNIRKLKIYAKMYMIYSGLSDIDPFFAETPGSNNMAPPTSFSLSRVLVESNFYYV